MKIFAIIGTLAAVVIIGFIAALYLNAAMAPKAIPEVNTPYGPAGGSLNPVDAARGIASMDRSRQQEMQNIMKRTGGVSANP